MNYIIYDLEFNQEYIEKNNTDSVKGSKCPFEIIQIGALKLDEKFNTIATFNRLVKPILHTDLHPYIKRLTNLTIEELNKAEPFIKVYEEFIQFIKGNENILCVWGKVDIKELFRNIEYNKLDISLIPKEYIDVQSYASKYLNSIKGLSVGLGNAVKLLAIPDEKDFHNAFNDAYYTGEVFKIIYNKEIVPKIYTPYKQRQLNNTKQKLDTNALIKQFEKMYDREMTKQEESIIKLAYVMGKTNQFQIDI